MRIRTVLEECEAHFHPIQPGSNLRGKSEWKHYGDGSYRFKISIREIALPDKSQIELWRDGTWLMRATVQNKTVKVDLENDSGSGIPAIKVGQILQIRHGDVLLAKREFNAE